MSGFSYQPGSANHRRRIARRTSALATLIDEKAAIDFAISYGGPPMSVLASLSSGELFRRRAAVEDRLAYAEKAWWDAMDAERTNRWDLKKVK